MTTTAGTSTAPSEGTRPNPYVGPRAFGYGEALYGRDRETADLLDTLIAERIVMLYSPSGAGKTSLIQAALRPALERKRFEVLSVVRVTHELPPDSGDIQPRNRYVLSTMLSLEEGLPPHLQHPVTELDAMTLAQYFQQFPDLDDLPGNEVVIFDQFEEILADPVDQDAKRAFFAELGDALRDSDLWALFSMREDFLAGLDPYRRLLPKRLQTRFRLDLLSVEAATQAMTRTAESAGVHFTGDAAAKLIDDLRRVRVQRPTGLSEELGPHVEPVQLQVACRRLWDRLAPDATEITVDDVEALGDVDSALADYYAESMARVAATAAVTERALRLWFEEDLITPQGFRGQVLEGPQGSAAALRELTATHLLRAEDRHGVTWYELAHDRLIAPVRGDNDRWLEANLTAFERQAMLWDSQDRPDSLLLTGPELDEEERALLDDPARASTLERDYLQACKRLRSEQERERRGARRIRQLLAVAVVGFVAAVVAGFIAWLNASEADEQARTAQQLTLEAKRSALVGQGFKYLSRDPELALLLAQQAAALGRGGELTDEERQLFEAAVTTVPRLGLGAKGTRVNAASFTSDGARIVLADDLGDVHVLNATNGKQEVSEKAPAKPLTVAAGPGAELVVWLDEDYRIWLWDRASGADPVEFFPADGLSPLGVGTSKDGTQVFVLGWDSNYNDSLQLLTATGELIAEPWVAPSGYVIYEAAGSRESDLVAVAGSEGVFLWKPFERTKPLQLEVTASTVAVSDDASLVVFGNDSGVTAWDVASGGELWSIPFRNVSTVALNSDATRVAVGTWDGLVEILDVTAMGTVLETQVRLPANTSAWRLEFDPRDDGRLLVVDTASAATLWDVRTISGDTTSIAISAEGHVGTSDYYGNVRVWSETGEELQAWTAHAGAAWDLAFFDEEPWVVTGGDDGKAVVWDISTAQPRTTVNVNEDGVGVAAVAASPDGHTFATGGWDGFVRTWSVTGEPGCTFDESSSGLAVVAFDESSRRLMAARWDGVTVYDLADCAVASTKATHPDGDLKHAAFDMAGRVMATVDDGGQRVEVYELDADSSPREMPVADIGRVNEVALSEDGQTLAAATVDRGLVLFETATGKRLQAFDSLGSVVHVRTAGSDRLVSLPSDRVLPFLVPLSDPGLQELAGQLSSRQLTSDECARLLPEELCEGWVGASSPSPEDGLQDTSLRVSERRPSGEND